NEAHVKVGTFVVNTCELLANTQHGFPTPNSLHSRTVISASLRRDIAALPTTVPQQLRSYLMEAFYQASNTNAQRIAAVGVALTGGAAFVNDYRATHVPLTAFQNAAVEMYATLDSIQLQQDTYNHIAAGAI